MFKLNLVTPEKKIVMDQELEEISLPAFRGEIDILPGHAPMLTTLGAGQLKYRLKSGESKKLAISWGYCQVSANGVNVLAETAVESNEVDINSNKSKLTTLEKRMLTETLNDQEWTETTNHMARLKAELDLVSK